MSKFNNYCYSNSISKSYLHGLSYRLLDLRYSMPALPLSPRLDVTILDLELELDEKVEL